MQIQGHVLGEYFFLFSPKLKNKPFFKKMIFYITKSPKIKKVGQFYSYVGYFYTKGAHKNTMHNSSSKSFVFSPLQ